MCSSSAGCCCEETNKEAVKQCRGGQSSTTPYAVFQRLNRTHNLARLCNSSHFVVRRLSFAVTLRQCKVWPRRRAETLIAVLTYSPDCAELISQPYTFVDARIRVNMQTVPQSLNCATKVLLVTHRLDSGSIVPSEDQRREVMFYRQISTLSNHLPHYQVQ